MGKTDKTALYIALVAIIALVAVVFFTSSNRFSAVDTGLPVDGSAPVPSANVQCDRGYTKDLSFVSRNSLDKGVAVQNVTYKVWKVVNGAKIPATDSTGALTIGYGETYEVIAQADGFKDKFTTVSVSNTCVASNDQVFYMDKLPTSVDVKIENSKVDLAVTELNRIPTIADAVRTVTLTLNGQSKTTSETIIVFDAEKTQFTIGSTSMKSADMPNSHTTTTGFRSYSYTLGTLDQANDLVGKFDITADRDAVLGDYNVTYTIYQKQTGFTDSVSGDYIVGNVVEDDSDNVLLPVFTGVVPLTVE